MFSYVYWCFVMCIDVLWCVLIFSYVYWCFVMCIDVFLCALMSCDMYWCFVMCIAVLWCTLWYSTMQYIKLMIHYPKYYQWVIITSSIIDCKPNKYDITLDGARSGCGWGGTKTPIRLVLIVAMVFIITRRHHDIWPVRAANAINQRCWDFELFQPYPRHSPSIL